MTKLTTDQIRQLNMYSVYVEQPEHPLFTLKDLLHAHKLESVLHAIQTISQSPNQTVAASYFLRRFGMFISMQFYQLAAYDEVWGGQPEQFTFGAKTEYGNQTISIFVNEGDFADVPENEREKIIRHILHDECNAIIQQVRSVVNISSLTLWENIFGFLLWHYHVLLENPATAEEARLDLNLLKEDNLWKGIAKESLFARYLKGHEPSALLNRKVRKTCCLSKDVPGLMQCGFCPLK
ncbi:hypothetical protein BI350_00315 [Sporosarcina ureilytica]|uniref:Aerobactin siderophore biosynthesis IucA/IucC-like C-terminal domain-containing protein n=2 Tax=Sporosarcina ureilytica TaxID=298596 RepID=A0A1D8JJY4_9BACL|nr:hypothetical protein BI350_00315 [Sporosarcina ureilytica]